MEFVPLRPVRELRGFLKGIDTRVPRDQDGVWIRKETALNEIFRWADRNRETELENTLLPTLAGFVWRRRLAGFESPCPAACR
jgi:hypothetical protein